MGDTELFLINKLSTFRDASFFPIDKNSSNVFPRPNTCGDQIGWITSDSTTLDSQKATRMCFDSVPSTFNYNVSGQNNSTFENYKSVYCKRQELPGQIQYYLNPTFSTPFFEPMFPKNTLGKKTTYLDPMNKQSTEFKRFTVQPTINNECEISEFRDEQNHREDMLSNILMSRNRFEYTPIYFNTLSK